MARSPSEQRQHLCGYTLVSRGTARVLHNATFGSTAAPTVVQDGGALDFWGAPPTLCAWGSEHIYVAGAGPDGNVHCSIPARTASTGHCRMSRCWVI